MEKSASGNARAGSDRRVKARNKGNDKLSSILIGIIVGYIAAAIMGLVLPTTGVTAEGVEYTKGPWVLKLG